MRMAQVDDSMASSTMSDANAREDGEPNEPRIGSINNNGSGEGDGKPKEAPREGSPTSMGSSTSSSSTTNSIKRNQRQIQEQMEKELGITSQINATWVVRKRRRLIIKKNPSLRFYNFVPFKFFSKTTSNDPQYESLIRIEANNLHVFMHSFGTCSEHHHQLSLFYSATATSSIPPPHLTHTHVQVARRWCTYSENTDLNGWEMECWLWGFSKCFKFCTH